MKYGSDKSLHPELVCVNTIALLDLLHTPGFSGIVRCSLNETQESFFVQSFGFVLVGPYSCGSGIDQSTSFLLGEYTIVKQYFCEHCS